MKRRQAEAQITEPGAVPPQLLAGPCIEVWVGADEKPPKDSLFGDPTWRAHQARRRYGDARQAFADERGLSVRQACALMPLGVPYSALYLVENGRGDYARERLGALADEVLGISSTPLPRRTP